jgi:hypothetical protein
MADVAPHHGDEAIVHVPPPASVAHGRCRGGTEWGRATGGRR